MTQCANVVIDNSFAWKTPATMNFPPSSVNGFTPLTRHVAAKKDKMFSRYLLSGLVKKHFTISIAHVQKYLAKLNTASEVLLR